MSKDKTKYYKDCDRCSKLWKASYDADYYKCKSERLEREMTYYFKISKYKVSRFIKAIIVALGVLAACFVVVKVFNFFHIEELCSLAGLFLGIFGMETWLNWD